MCLRSSVSVYLLISAVTAFAIGLSGTTAGAQGYPQRPITMIVPFATGGPTDVVARLLGQHMSKSLGREIVIENTTGGGGTTATLQLVRAAPDGYTIQMGNMGTHAAAVALNAGLPYDPERDFAPIGVAAAMPVLILARDDLPAKTLKDFIAYVSTAENVKMAHAGVGSVSYTTCLLLNSILRVKPISVPYNGTGPALNALIAGEVDYMCDQTAAVVDEVTLGTVKALAIASPTRNRALPNVPTTAEAGLPQFQVSAWNALFAPKQTPQPVLDKLTEALDAALNDKATRERLAALGSDIPNDAGRGQRALRHLLADEIEHWMPIGKASQAGK